MPKIKESYKRIEQIKPIQPIKKGGHSITLGTLGLPATLSLARRAGNYNPGPDLAHNLNMLIRACNILRLSSLIREHSASRSRPGLGTGRAGFRHFQSGFTLIEILIAIFIFAVVLTTIYTSYTGAFRIVDETESQAEIYRMARIALERMLEDLESGYIPKNPETGISEESHPPSSQFVGEDMEIKGRYADTLRFTSRAHVNLSGQEQDPGAVEISYYVMESEEGDDFVLYRGDRPIFEEAFPLEENTGGLVLCDRLVSVDFTYHDENGEVRENWDSTSDEFKGKLPKMVSISLEFVNNSNPEVPFRFTTSVALPMSRDINEEAS